MKRFFVVFGMVLISYMTSAQVVQNFEQTTKGKKFLPHFEQVVDFSYDNLLSYDYSSFTVSYIAGYHIMPRLFLGGGLGFSFTIDPHSDLLTYNRERFDFRTTNTLNIPLFAHVRASLLDGKHTPFFALSIGGRFSTKREANLALGQTTYGTCGFIVNPQIGMSHDISKSRIYYAIGFLGQTYPTITSITSSSLVASNKFCNGLNVHVGITF